jgi:hypothetical protein
MTQKEITIGGQQYPVTFDLHTMIVFENDANRSFFTVDFEHMSLKDRIYLIHAAVKSADDSAKLTVDDIKGQRSFNDMKDIMAASNEIIIMSADFFPIPEIEKKNNPEPPAEETEDDEKQKN